MEYNMENSLFYDPFRHFSLINQSEISPWVSDDCSAISGYFSEISFCSSEDSRFTIGTSNINDIKNDVKAKEIIPKKVMVVTFQTSLPSCFF